MARRAGWALPLVLLVLSALCGAWGDESVPADAAAAGAAAKKAPPSPKKLKSNADLALSKREYGKAAQYLSQLIELEPTQINYYARAQAYQKDRSFDKAIADLTTAVEKDPKFHKGYMTRAQIKVTTGDCESAIADFQHVISLNPKKQGEVDKKLAQARECMQKRLILSHLMAVGKTHEAKNVLAELLKIAYESDALMMKKVDLALAEKDYQQVLVDTREILKKDKSNLEALLLGGKAYYHMQDYKVAENFYREGLRLAPEHKELKELYKMVRRLTKLTASAESNIQSGQYEAALESLEEAITVDPSNTHHQYKLYLMACDANTKARERAPAEGEALPPHLLRPRKETALMNCSAAISLDPAASEGYMKRAELYEAWEKWQDAINDWTHAQERGGNQQKCQQQIQHCKLRQKMADRKDYYKILGVEKDADGGAIKRAFRKLALKWHPDKHAGDEEKARAELEFREVGEAYEILSDDEKRGKYDRGEDIKPEQHGGGGGHPFAQFFQQGGGQQFHFKFN